MRFQFKIQDYQTQAVEDTVNVFRGQPKRMPKLTGQIIHDNTITSLLTEDIEVGCRNDEIELTSDQLLSNIKEIQVKNQIAPSQSLSEGLGSVNLDIEMETGTGKTYVYIKTMFELNRQYGWNKFIVIVPSIAIREGVAKSFSMLEEHFMEHYGKKARWYVYKSSNLNQLRHFSQDNGISVLIINTQAFATALNEKKYTKESRIIYSQRDEFGSSRPIDIIAATRPIIIMDEPQKMEGKATQSALENFNPLFILYYSATHKTKHDTIYALDAYDAYKERLVKRIKVQGFEIKNLKGTNGYMYIDSIVLSPKRAPEVKIEIEVRHANGSITREVKKFAIGDSLYTKSGLAQYKNCIISEINPLDRGSVTFINGMTLNCGEITGSTDEETLQRLQIRQTIIAHLTKEKELFNRGIKCLSLYFIDEVSHYRQYDKDGYEIKAKFQKIFEDEYKDVVKDFISHDGTPYDRYLESLDASETHRGYFSIDRKGRSINSKEKDSEENKSAFDMILKNKERLLSFDEPTRFIFSHSALREGWDNPNIFQICTLRHSNSVTAKRQEVGRGLRICVDRNGIRQDKELLGEDVHEINSLTVIANESYSAFTSALQRETRDALRVRVTAALPEYFQGKIVTTADGQMHKISSAEAATIYGYLYQNDYVDENGQLTPTYHAHCKNGTLVPLCQKLQPIATAVMKLIAGIFDPEVIKNMVERVPVTTAANELNENFTHKEFQKLWKEINHKYVYTVNYDSDELTKKAIDTLNRDLNVTELQYVMVTGIQNESDVTEFGKTKSSSGTLTDISTSTVKYDVVGDIAKGARLTRKTVAKILKGIGEKVSMFKNNPEEFIHSCIRIIKEQKATMIVEHITYNPSNEQPYDSTIFVPERRLDINKVLELSKHVTQYVSYDSEGEKEFAKSLQNADEVLIFAKLPRRFKIKTPVGNYAPDWAIVFTEGAVRHIFFIAETKGSLENMELRGIELAKIECAKKLFNSISDHTTKYGVVDKFENLYNIINGI